jgi:intracellular septation protein A
LPLSPSLSPFFLDFFFLLALFCVYRHIAGVYMASWIALVAAGMILVYMYYYNCYL